MRAMAFALPLALAMPVQAETLEAIVVRACVDTGLFRAASDGQSAVPVSDPLPAGLVVSRVAAACRYPLAMTHDDQRVQVTLHILDKYRNDR